jgi:hypothetical protein
VERIETRPKLRRRSSADMLPRTLKLKLFLLEIEHVLQELHDSTHLQSPSMWGELKPGQSYEEDLLPMWMWETSPILQAAKFNQLYLTDWVRLLVKLVEFGFGHSLSWELVCFPAHSPSSGKRTFCAHTQTHKKNIYIYIYIYVCVYVCVYTYIHICIYIYIFKIILPPSGLQAGRSCFLCYHTPA